MEKILVDGYLILFLAFILSFHLRISAHLSHKIIDSFFFGLMHLVDEGFYFLFIDHSAEEIEDETGEGSIEAIPMIDDIHDLSLYL